MNIVVVLAIVGIGLLWSGLNLTAGRALLFIGAIALTQSLCILPHELGHVFAALISGMRVFTVNIGQYGRILFIWRLFGYDFVFRSIPMGGSTLARPKGIVFPRLRYFVFALGGPLANVLLIALAIPLSGLFIDEDAIFWGFTGFIWGNVVMVAINLFPRKVGNGIRKVPNDGLVLLSLPFKSNNFVKGWHAQRFYLEALEAAERGRLQDAENWFAAALQADPNNSWAPHGMAYVLSQLQRYQEARDALLKMLAKSENNPQMAAIIQNNVAWADLMIGDPKLLDEADHFSKKAIEIIPWASYLKGTRGSVLVELGNTNEGIQLLMQALKENDNTSLKALNACYLAIAMMRMGNRQRANEYVEDAKRRDPHCPLLQRTLKELEGQTFVH